MSVVKIKVITSFIISDKSAASIIEKFTMVD